MKFNFKLGVIGYGNMSSAIVNGVISSKLLEKNQILIFDIDDEKKNCLVDNGFRVAENNSKVVENCEFVLIAVKPQYSGEVFENINDSISGNIFISIMAGVEISTIQDKLCKEVKVARCMPNTPCKIGMGMCAVDVSLLSEEEGSFVLQLFASTGKAIEVEEKLLHAVTSISGSGPAYVYYFINSMIKSGIENGLSYEQSKCLTLQTFLGATEMIKQSDDKIENLIEAVCSKGGTTIQTINYFNDVDLEGYIEEGIGKCYKRSVELGKLK